MNPKPKSQRKPHRKITNVSLREFESMINKYGHIEEGSKHPKAIIENFTLPYKRENPIKACYVKELYNIIDSL